MASFVANAWKWWSRDVRRTGCIATWLLSTRGARRNFDKIFTLMASSQSIKESGSELESNVDDILTQTPPKKKAKRYCVFNSDWLAEESLSWLSKVDDFTANCTVCQQSFSVKYDGKSAVSSHAKSTKHKNAIAVQKQNKTLSAFFVKTNSEEEHRVILAELVSTYHGVIHHHSFASQDCGNKLLAKLCPDSAIASKVSCGRTKAASYVENVLGPKAQEMCIGDLKNVFFFSIGSDASNKGNKKLFPVVVRYFSKTSGIVDALLDFYNDNDESSEAIAHQLKSIIENNELSLCSVSSYAADNASVNYGKHSSVYQKLKLNNPNIVQANCNCHVLNNCVKYALKGFAFDVESFVIKTYNSFASSAKKSEALRDFCDFLEIEYRELLRHVPTRWLSLLPAIDRLLLCWPALKSYFTSQGEDSVADIIWTGFSCEENLNILPHCTLYFVHNVLSIFEEAIKRLESNATTATELHGIMVNIEEKLQQRWADKFYGSSATKLLKSDEVNSSDRQKFTQEVDQFFQRCLSYLHKWYDYDHSFFKDIATLSLDNDIQWSALLSLVERLGISINSDKLYEELCALRKVRSELLSLTGDVSDRWVKFFATQQPEDTQLLRLVSYVLSIPVSNANCERVFSTMTALWTDSRNRLSLDLVKAELMMKMNFHMSCSDFYEFIRKDKELLRAAKSQGKYRFKLKTD